MGEANGDGAVVGVESKGQVWAAELGVREGEVVEAEGDEGIGGVEKDFADREGFLETREGALGLRKVETDEAVEVDGACVGFC